jgi:hypothetical protein
MNARTSSNTGYALAYPKLLPGFFPFPLVCNEKKPLYRGWQNRDQQQAITIFTEQPLANMGLAIPECHFALDIDNKGACNGFETLAALKEKHGKLPTTLTQTTPSGGQHRIFKLPPGVKVKNLVGIAPGLDTRSMGGFIACEPSSINGKPYAWLDFDVEDGELPEIAIAPDWLIKLCQGAQSTEKTFIASDGEMAIVEGGRNNALFKKASAMRGQGFSGDEIVDALQGMNQRLCSPPLSLRDVKAIAASASKYNPNPDSAINCIPTIMAKEVQSVIATLGPLEVPMHLLTIPGVLGAMVDWTNETSVKPQPYFAVQAALAFGSVVLGRKYRTTNNNWPSLFFLNIGVSASGKEHAKTVIEEALHASDLEKLIGACEYTSDSAVDSLLLEKPTHITIMDELGLILEAANSKSNHNGATARRRLMEVFGRSHGTLQPKAFSTASLTKTQRAERENRAIENPALTLLALTTPGTFFSAVGSGSMKDGFLNRFIIVISDIGRQAGRRNLHKPPPKELTSWAKSRRIIGSGDIVEFGIDTSHNIRVTPIEIPFNLEAENLFDKFDELCVKRMDDLEAEGVAEMYGRVCEIAMKISLIVSQSCESATITAEHAQWAIDYVQYWTERSIRELVKNIADSPFASLCNEVANHVSKAGAMGLTIVQLSRKSANFKGADDRMRNNIFKNLLDDRGITKVEFVSDSGRGKPRIALVDLKNIARAD